MNNQRAPHGSAPADQTATGSRWAWLLVAAGVLAILMALIRPRHHGGEAGSAPGPTNAAGPAVERARTGTAAAERARSIAHVPRPGPVPSAQEIVAGKVLRFGRSRREIVRAIARRSQKVVPAEVEKFFDAIESGEWEGIQAQWRALATWSGQYDYSTGHREDLDPCWEAVLDAYGVAEQAHNWPAQELLDYGNTILDSLKPGMVYVGGTDNGRWIPELLNDTSDGEQHIIVTQNAMADSRYLDYMNTLFGDRMTPLTQADSQSAFADYLTDVQKRFQHDQDYPDEPKQLRPGEDFKMVDGKAQVSGSVAVMAINERLLQTLMQKNPDLTFAMQESFPLPGTYADALPLGPLMELRARSEQNSFTPERAAQALDYWQTTAQRVLADPAAGGSADALKSYSHDAVAAANLLAAHNYSAEAEQAYRLASQLWPDSPESAGGLAGLLARSGRETEARRMLDDFARQHPDQQKQLERASTIIWTLDPAHTTSR